MIQNNTTSFQTSAQDLTSLLASRGKAAGKDGAGATAGAASPAATPAPANTDPSTAPASVKDINLAVSASPIESAETAAQATQSARQTMLAQSGVALRAQANLDSQGALHLLE